MRNRSQLCGRQTGIDGVPRAAVDCIKLLGNRSGTSDRRNAASAWLYNWARHVQLARQFLGGVEHGIGNRDGNFHGRQGITKV